MTQSARIKSASEEKRPLATVSDAVLRRFQVTEKLLKCSKLLFGESLAARRPRGGPGGRWRDYNFLIGPGEASGSARRSRKNGAGD